MPLHHWIWGILMYTSEKENDFQFILKKSNDKIWTIEICSCCFPSNTETNVEAAASSKVNECWVQ